MIKGRINKQHESFVCTIPKLLALIAEQRTFGEYANPARLAVLQRVQGCIQKAAARLGVDGILRGDVEYVIGLADARQNKQ